MITSELQRTIESAQATGQRRVRERSVGKLQTALRQRIVKSSADRHIDGSESGCSNVGVETRNQLEIDTPVGGEIQAASTRELHRAMSSQISSLAEHVQLFNVN